MDDVFHLLVVGGADGVLLITTNSGTPWTKVDADLPLSLFGGATTEREAPFKLQLP